MELSSRKRKWVAFIAVAVFVLCAIGLSQAEAGEITAQYGLNTSYADGLVKVLQIDYRSQLYKKLWQKVGGTYWFTSGDAGLNGGLAAYSLGTAIHANPLYADLFWGVGYCTNPDGQFLSGHFQFTNDVSVGIIQDGVGVGIAYKHISNAGIVEPNRGRDFVMFQLRFGL